MSNESNPSEIKTETLQKVSFGVVCWSCKQEVAQGYAELKSGAQIADLQKSTSAKAEAGRFATCQYVYPNGVVCGAANHITLGEIVFVDESQTGRHTLVDDPSQG